MFNCSTSKSKQLNTGLRFVPSNQSEKESEKDMKEYIIQGKYVGIWEDVTVETDLKEAKERLKEYNENESQYPHRLITRRVK